MENKKTCKSNLNCSVYGCGSMYKKNPNLRFHAFPHSGKEKVGVRDTSNNVVLCDRRKLWETRLMMGREVSNSMKVCSLHFVEDDYLTPVCHSLRYLKNTAVPTQNLPKCSVSTEKSKRYLQKKLNNVSESVAISHEAAETLSLLNKAQSVIGNFYKMEVKESNCNHQEKFRIVFNCELNAPEPHKCKYCLFKTHWQVVLRDHITVDHEEKESSASEYKLKCYKCKDCNFKTFSLVVLTGHECGRNRTVRMDINTKTKWHECERCSYSFISKNHLQTHIQRKHKKIDKIHWLKCGQCGYKSLCSSTLQRHFNTKHRIHGLNMFKCEHCPFETNYKLDMRMHCLHEHTEGVVCFKCEKCAYKTLYKEQFNRHIVAKHTNANTKNNISYNCEHCTFATNYRNSLTRHVKMQHLLTKVAGGYTCVKCSYKSKYKQKVLFHLKTHVKAEEL